MVPYDLVGGSRRYVLFPQALQHPYFFALPYPSHPSKLPKASKPLAPRPLPLEEIDGNASPGLNVKAGDPIRLKRKAADDASPNRRSVSRKLEFTAVPKS
jgi:cyclin-dependent kinase 7